MVERAIIRIIHNKIIEVYTQPREKSSFSSTTIPYLSEKGNQIQHGPREKYGNGKKIPFFLSPINVLQVFLSQEGKIWTRGENIILFLLKLISKNLSRKEGKVIPCSMARGKNIDTEGKNIFPL
jgi:hypothetical protein